MHLHLPDPRRMAPLAAEVASVVPRALHLLTATEQLLRRVDELVDRIEQTRQAADAVIVRTAGTVGSAEPTLRRAEELLDSFAPSLQRLQPTLDRLAETTHPDEVTALVDLIDHLPMLVARLETDIVPILENLGTVGPDIHDLLDTVQGLGEMLAKVPGLARMRQRGADAEDQRPT
ncbi:hypothetical protein HMPREF0063_12019 [Aeromicrobium marinum DSM 15272]|uniref:Uncharacterized protein n=1 Tax=Aeromicrobium marinum DSM 15272 TaxID=585531 RepID=E2SE83_9ACTN|nr:hypothetical protein [Aeromicrobium marinum]EFQ82810.1 hypothetical protein HMPREF0063_12019 [Aeromicrobium marinum DSM 15272]